MTLHYGGKYNGDEKSLPQREHHPNAVAFIEAASTKELSLMCNCGCIFTDDYISGAIRAARERIFSW